MMTVFALVDCADDVCDKHLNSGYRDLARAMTKVLCRRATIAERFVLNIVDLNPRPRNS
jgi:hypothetical protein